MPCPESLHLYCSCYCVFLTMSSVKFVAQNDWKDAKGPLGIDRPSPKLAVNGESDPQWFKDLQRDGVSILSGEFLGDYDLMPS